ncbi:MAG: hypothetical protein HY060_01460 [Proteobacteria bacterium]|nr:hypothetical protein [Pseudomonadota bacterium]
MNPMLDRTGPADGVQPGQWRPWLDAAGLEAAYHEVRDAPPPHDLVGRLAPPPVHGLRERIGDLLGRLARALDDRRRRRALGRELADLEARHILGATLDDIGLSRAQLPGLLGGFPQRQRQFRRMLARLGVPESRIADRATRNDLIWTCTTCPAGKRCRHWLDAGRTRGYAAFCPNAAALKRLAAAAWPSPRHS